jgi:hypothetical protein
LRISRSPKARETRENCTNAIGRPL